ncbi:hypothetical protein [Sphaerimonospora thailandensis]|uniref:Uncharacterized protein n=1 Tax=Sphaerimonospora thailandensis TaxID=795644 RepID=A0A8J3R847_9ACTN|nr:hypothetical protein [Sphaerimonospora thailandensis]GIH69174.1 hypothetical protein Mth01_14270 [Sphaerimonospora thailandensis]
MRTIHGITTTTVAGAAIAAVVTTILTVTTASGALGAPGRISPSASPGPVAPAVGPSSPADAGPVKPHRRTLGTHKVRWRSVKPIAHGRKLRITWWSGVAPCTVLDRVKTKETARKVVVTLYEGTDPAAKDTMCISIAIKKSTTVKLRAPLGKRKIVDGAKPKPTPEPTPPA